MVKTRTICVEEGSGYTLAQGKLIRVRLGHHLPPKAIGWGLLAASVIGVTCFYDGFTGIFLFFITLMALHGYWLGATKVGTLFGGLLAGVLLGVPLGNAAGSGFPTLFHFTGMLGRAISTGLCVLVIAALVTFILKAMVYRWLKPRPRWKRYDRLLGSAMGLIQGVLLGLLFLWTLLTLEPVAATSLAHNKPPEASISTNSISQQIVDFTKTARSSTAGWLADTFNPFDEIQQLALLADGIVVLNDPHARAQFINHPTIQDIQHYPSVKQALEMLAADPTIVLTLEAGSTTEVVQAVLTSPTLLDIFDQTRILEDLTPLADDIAQAVEAAMEHRNK